MTAGSPPDTGIDAAILDRMTDTSSSSKPSGPTTIGPRYSPPSQPSAMPSPTFPRAHR